MIKKLSKEKGTTILISSHILSEVEQMADFIGISDNGHLLVELPMDEIKRRNRHYVKMRVSDAARAMLVFEKELGITDIECVSLTAIALVSLMGIFCCNRVCNLR